MMVVAINRSEPQDSNNAEESKKAGSSNMLAAFITGEYKDGFIEPERPAPTEPALDLPPEIMIARPSNLDLPPLPPVNSLERDPASEHIRMMKLQLFEQAVKAKTNVAMEAPRSAGAGSSSPPSANYAPSGVTPSRKEALARIAAVRQQVDAQAKMILLLPILRDYNKSRTVGLSVAAMVWMIQHQN